MSNINNISVKELLRDLTINQFNLKLRDYKSNIDENTIKLIQDKIWTNILIKKNRKLLNNCDLITEIDNNLSNIMIYNNYNSNNSKNVDIIKNLNLKIVDEQFISFIPLFVLSYKAINYYYTDKNNDFILQLLYVILGSLDLSKINYWNNSSLIEIFYSEFSLKLYSTLENEIKKINHSIFDFKQDLPSFFSILFKNNYISLDLKDIWFQILYDFKIGVEIIRHLFIENKIANSNLFNNEFSNMGNFNDETEISNNISNIAGEIFGLNKTNIEKFKTNNINGNKETLIASFMGFDDNDQNFNDLDNEELPLLIENDDILEINKNVNNEIITRDNIFKNNHINFGNLDLKNSSYDYFTNLTKILEYKKKTMKQNQDHKLINFSTVKLPNLLEKISKRKIIEYNKKYIGISWDQQYLNKNTSNKTFNESILNVLTTERIKNCNILVANSKNNQYLWININSILRLFQGLPSIEFNLFPKYYKNKTIDYFDIYTFQLDNDSISIRLNENYGELCPWMNNNGRGVKYIFDNNIVDNMLNINHCLYLSRDLINNICTFGTKVYYFKSFIELLINLCNKIDNDQNYQDIFTKNNLFIDYNKENIISIKILKSTLLEFLQIYNRDITTLFNHLLKNNDLNKVNTSININILLNIFSHIFEVFIRIFNLKTTNNTNYWKLNLGYLLLSNMYYNLWQFQVSNQWMIKFNNPIFINNSSNLVNNSIYTSNYILSILYKNLLQGLLNYQLNQINTSNIKSNSNQIFNKSIFKSIIIIFERILTIKNIYSPKFNELNLIYNSINYDLPKDELSIFFTEKDELFISNCENFYNSRLKSNYKEILVDYLKNNQLNFHCIYQIYYNYLNQVYYWIINNKFNIEHFIDISFKISEILQKKNIDNISISNINILTYLKQNLSKRYKQSNSIPINKYIGSIIWMEDNYDVLFQQFQNYNNINKITKINQLLKFVLGININLSINKNEHNIQDNKEIYIFNNLHNLSIPNENLVLNKLLQLLIIMDILSNKYLIFKTLINRFVMYIWCRKNTTDFNLYIKFSNGYLYDSFSLKLMDFIARTETHIHFIYYNIQKLLDYIILLLKKFNFIEDLKSRNHQNYFIKWKIFQYYYKQKLYCNLNINQLNFLFSLISLIHQICLISSDIISYFDSLTNIPKRPSTFHKNKNYSTLDHQGNVLLEFLQQWNNNNLNHKIHQLFNVISSLKSHISQNKSQFNIENHFILYYLFS